MKLPFALTSTLLFLCLCSSLFAQTSPQQGPPPEHAELLLADQIADPSARVKEYRRIKAAYPETTLSMLIDMAIIRMLNQTNDSFDGLVAAQREVIAPSKIQDRFEILATAALMLMAHPGVAEFPNASVLKIIQEYKADAMELLSTPEGRGRIQESRIASARTNFEMPLAKALVMNGNGEAALDVLVEFRKTATPIAITGDYFHTLGEAYSLQKQDKEALEAFFEAAVGTNNDAVSKARSLFIKAGGTVTGFESELKRRQALIPFQPMPFVAPANWKGKTVLAEVFTGSECPPCVAAAFAFDGLKETYTTQYLAILKYHTPIPRYDPLMNHATKKRQDFYQAYSNPTVIIDGVKRVGAGGPRAASSGSYDRIKTEIDLVMEAPVEVTIKATAALNGDAVRVECEFSKVIEGADYNVVLVQSEVDFMGGNAYPYHKMVVRDISTAASSEKATIIFNIPEAEKLASEHITEWGNTARDGAKQGSSWPEKQNKIDRSKLKVVVFVQDKQTKQVLNAYVTDVTH